MLTALSEIAASMGRMACTQDGRSTGASASASSVWTDVCCEGISSFAGSCDIQSGISTEKSESTSWLERGVESAGSENISEPKEVVSGWEGSGDSASGLDSNVKFFHENGSSGAGLIVW